MVVWVQFEVEKIGNLTIIRNGEHLVEVVVNG